MMAALAVFRQVLKVADSDFLALEVLPVLWSFSLGPLLDLNQFSQFMALIKSISSKVEREQMKKLQELSSGDSSGFRNGTAAASQNSNGLAQSETESTRDNFERLVLGQGATESNEKTNDLWGGLVSDTPSAQPPMQPLSSPTTTFSWSSNTPGSASKQSSQTTRSITPDMKLNSFPSLQPQPTGMQSSSPAAAFPPLQPTAPNPWTMQTNAGHHQPSPGPSPSLASLSNMNAPSTSSNRTNLQTTPNYSAFIPPPPSTQAPSAFTSTARPSMSASIGQSSPFSSNSTMQAQSETQKQGLDKYQSLI